MNGKLALYVVSIVGVLVGFACYRYSYPKSYRLKPLNKRKKDDSNKSPFEDDSSGSSQIDDDIKSTETSISIDRNPNIKFKKLIMIPQRNSMMEMSPTCFPTYNWENNTWRVQCNKIMKYGFPGTENIYFRDKYVFSYNFKHKQPNWVMESLQSRQFHDNDVGNNRTNCQFIVDPEIPQMFSSRNEDYYNSGYDRGHLAAYANHRSNADDNCSTFFLSNISPQIGVGFNRNIWEQLESHTRHLKNHIYNKVYACTGTLFIPTYSNKQGTVSYKIIGKGQVSVPTHYFKIIMGIKTGKIHELECYIIPNSKIPDDEKLESFRVSLEEIEKYSGLIFFPILSRSDLVYAANIVKVNRKVAFTKLS